MILIKEGEVMLVMIVIFYIISLILTYKMSIKDKKNRNNAIDNRSIILGMLIYLAVAYFLSQFYSFNPLEVDVVEGVRINPYVSFISIILQYLNILLINDTWIKTINERKGNRLHLYMLTIIYNITVTIGAYLLYVGYTGTEEEIIYSSIPFFINICILTLYLPFVIYDINLIKIISKKSDNI